MSRTRRRRPKSARSWRARACAWPKNSRARSNLPFLQTARLRLRPIEHADISWLAELLADPEVKQLTLDVPLPADRALAVARVLVSLWRRSRHWAIVRAADGEPCGFICLARTGSLGGPRGWYVGFELRRPCWNQGIATEALRAVIDCAFDQWEARCVRAAVREPHAASMRVLEKAGLVKQGACRLPGNRPGYWYELRREQAGRAALPPGWWAAWKRWLRARRP
ncbi:MAG: GNAT family N-acetyltransferase [Bryobacterales bacterium]|nr:GNAT family N-acetyltransferase [Bryobacterales bacterium]